MVTMQQVTAAQAHTMLEALTQLLQDAVESGASVGFLPPLDAVTARTYWVQTIDEAQHEARLLWVACQHSDIVGTVQLALALQPNARHRAEVQKLMVHTRQRRQGLGRALMRAVRTQPGGSDGPYWFWTHAAGMSLRFSTRKWGTFLQGVFHSMRVVPMVPWRRPPSTIICYDAYGTPAFPALPRECRDGKLVHDHNWL